ncbi:phosphatidylinositol 4,5-bisphosphate 3-kinase catalytic subunit beta isoform isoform X2 [Octopus sinensis]|nr:phosphatidylinositol 4,5-bisphosphate 3-kinase catalytic subunit beta isoform isoform X2 [Octopus sinensis]XP_029643425.1 phosphatidylinositol 4,5-bisphosphate 3-kinase catalytic subunit beta isoform isoform X2 [Octopus sinensis]
MVVVYVPDVSSAVDNKGHIIFDFLMPNGILITMKVDFYCATFEKIKQDLWLEASKQPLYFLLRSYEEYAFQFINNQGKREEVLWESQSLSEIQLCATFLKLIEKELNNERRYSLDRRINSLISIPSYELTDLQSSEVENFRVRIKAYCDKIVLERDHLGWDERIKYCFPPRLCKEELRANMVEKLNTEKLNEGYFSIEISRGKKVVKEEVLCNFYPKQLVSDLVKRRPKELGLKDLDAANYLLKVSGLDEYLYGNHALIDFKFIYECLHKDSVPRVCLVTRSEVCLPAPTIPPRKSSSSFSSRNTQENVIPDIHSWDIFSKVTIKINCVTQVEISDGNKIKVVAGLYLGHDVLCDVVSTDELALSQRTCVWNSELTFDHLVSDLPEMTRICFMLYSVGTGKNKKQKDANPLAWANIPLFDYKSQLRCNTCELFMWPIQDDLQLDEPCFPIGTVTPNPAGKKATTLRVYFSTYNRDKRIVYPQKQEILGKAAENMEPVGSFGSPMWRPNKIVIDQVRKIIEEGNALFEQDKELLWRLRHEIKHRFPNSLPLLLSSVKWNNKIDLSKMQALLMSWPKLNCEHSLGLLDFAYADRVVREFAVSCLQELPDDEIMQYLLQLVQILKYESYLYCPIVELLLSRALRNRCFGHRFFWLLKSEMHECQVNVRFGLILEVYCKSCADHTKDLIRQNEALLKINSANMLIKNTTLNIGDKKVKDTLLKDFHAVLSQKAYTEALNELHSPLNPLWKMNKLIIDECKFLDSKKRPVWLVWRNEEAYQSNEKFSIIYKNGDDLRQDMLTLQIIQIVDSIWQEEGVDLKMNPYGCLCTGENTGMIEVVSNAETIASIQRNYGAVKCVYEWLKQHNTTDEKLAKAVTDFSLSCAGYSVITYVLGIGDRHNDNIMIKTNGQLFHIDFGHILGNKKKKFGVRRERVPFVLTSHFVYVIKNGEGQNDNFQKFEENCQLAYMILRRRSHVLITLFNLMLQSGLPELSSDKDVEYLRKALALGASDQEASQQFRAKLKEAQNKCWTTELNWWFHSRNVDNT